MRFRRHGAFFPSLALSFCVVAGCSQSSPSPSPSRENAARTGSTEQAIQGGSVDGTAHPFAVGICIGNSPGPTQNCGICSGALITPNLVVTARHCVDHTDKVIDCSANLSFGVRNPAMFVTTNPSLATTAGNVGWHQVVKVYTPTDNHICGNDIALLKLGGLVGSAEATPIVPGVQYPMSDADRYVHHFTSVGFGRTGPEGLSGVTVGTRRILATIPIECIPGDATIDCPKGFSPNEFYGGDGTCEGDSGSSAFDDLLFNRSNPTYVSFGVLSRGGDNAGDAGQAATLCKGSLYTRLDKFRDLILQAATDASSNWTTYPKPSPDWTVFVPPATPKPPADAGPTPKKPQDQGAPCASNEECKSKVCADTGFGKACTQACVEATDPTTCPAGFICKAAVCVQDIAGATAPTAEAAPATITSSSCSIGGRGRGNDAPLGLLGAVAAVLGLGLRRRKTA